jgi:hypothetical protein
MIIESQSRFHLISRTLETGVFDLSLIHDQTDRQEFGEVYEFKFLFPIARIIALVGFLLALGLAFG